MRTSQSLQLWTHCRAPMTFVKVKVPIWWRFSSRIYIRYAQSIREIQAEKRFSSSLKAQILYAYRQYEEYLKKTAYSVSAIKIFDGAEAPVFLDWSHVNARGNEVIANFIFEELQIRGLLNRVSDL